MKRHWTTLLGIVLLSLVSPAFSQDAEWDALNKQVMEHYRAGRYDQAVEIAKRSLELAEANGDPNSESVATSLNNLAGLYQAVGEYEQAEPIYLRSLDILEKTRGPEHPLFATNLNNLAGLYQTMGRYAEAVPLHLRSMAIREKVLGPDHPSCGDKPEQSGGTLFISGRI